MLFTPDNATPVAVGDVFPPGALRTELRVLLVPAQRDLFVWTEVAPGAIVAARTTSLGEEEPAALIEGFVESWLKSEMHSVDGWVMLWPNHDRRYR